MNYRHQSACHRILRHQYTMHFVPVIVVLLLHDCIGIEQVKMTLVSLNHFKSQFDSEYQCHLSNPDSSDVAVESLRLNYTRRSNGNNPPPPDPVYQRDAEYPHYKIAMNNSNNNNAFGVFGCRARKNGKQDTVISTTRMRSDADIVPSNELFTQTVNAGDGDVTVSMRSRTKDVSLFRWRKDNSTVLTSGNSNFTINGPIALSDRGIYECHINRERNKAKQGLTLLIVRGCQANRWGPPNCTGVCDSCYNGGICDENNGECVCAPGFKGENCLEACGGNTFGYACEKKCLSDGSNDSCSGKLFCLVHPFGCRCNTGWKGLNCDSACDDNTFGASCLQSCHCESDQCNGYTGECTGGNRHCKSGWTGQNCQECDGNFFGADCSKECHCTKDKCNRETGLCKPGGCLPQWVDQYPPYSCQTGLKNISSIKVNPGTSTIVWCTAVKGEGGTNLNSFEMVLSRDSASIVNDGIFAGNSSSDDSMMMQSFSVNGAEEGDVLYCQLHKDGAILAVLNVTLEFFILPVLAAIPMKEFINTTTITISWQAWNKTKHEGDGPVIGYIPYYKETEEAADWMKGERVSSSEVLMFSATSLKPGTMYSFSVAAVREGDGGEGVMSPILNVATNCTVPPSPENVMAILSGEKKQVVLVSWQLPSEEIACSSGVTGFTIYYSSSNTALESVNVPDPAATTFILSDITPDLSHTLYVTLSTSGGESRASNEIEFFVPVTSSSPFATVAVSTVVAMLLIILVLLTVVFMMKRRNSGKSKETGNSGIPMNSFKADVCVQHKLSEDYVQSTDDELEDEDVAKIEENSLYANLEKPVSILLADLENYVNNCSTTGTGNFEQQFMTLNGNEQFDSNVGRREENRVKNRFKNLIAYDHSRVVLKTVDGDPHSDYYNANYIKNVEGVVAFIASQGPNKASVNDFWRMVLQEKVHNIVMLTNLVEGGKDRCFQYWPPAVGKAKTFGNIQLVWEREEQFANYDLRELQLKQRKHVHKVNNWHFKTWPDKDVPHQVSPLLEFVNKVTSAQQAQKTGHLLVHCSAGIGRTGTFIAIYSLLDVVKAGTRIDIYGFVEQMRQDRPKMVQTLSQYRFVHECLLEAFLMGDTKIPIDSIPCFDASSERDKLSKQFQLLKKLDQRSPKSHVATTEQTGKSRYPEIMPVDSKRPYLQSPGKTSSSDFINACFVASYRKNDAFIATQSPLPNTVEDFWRLVYDTMCPLIVMLNQLDSTDQTCCKYWPDSGSSQTGHMKVELKHEKKMGCYVYRLFDVTHTFYQKTRSVHHMQSTPRNERDLSYIINLIQEMEKLQHDYNMVSPTIVHCLNGVGRTGMFLTAKSEMERVEVEQTFDVFSTVRQLRSSNTSFVYTENHSMPTFEKGVQNLLKKGRIVDRDGKAHIQGTLSPS